MWQLVTAALILGLISSLHCVGMCGPIALALPIHAFSTAKKTLALLAYHTGRLLTYTSLGILFGLLGRHIYLAGIQRWFSIALGIIMLIVVVQYFIFKHSMQPRWMQQYYSKLTVFMGKQLRSASMISFLLLGMANGLLPCGMVYMALAGALTTTSVSHGALFMALFGAATFPAMLLLSYFGHLISLPIRNNIKRVMPYFIAIMAVLFILRGMNLGIPYISPVLQNSIDDAIQCH